MVGFLGEGYLWMKAFHIMAVMAWLAGMWYQPRLYIYHCEAEPGSQMSETFKVMERRLLRAIINPAMIASWISGVALVAHLDAWTEAWMVWKFVLLIGMQISHASYARWRRHFAEDANRHSHVYYRVQNEVPTVLMIGIVILVVVRPF